MENLFLRLPVEINTEILSKLDVVSVLECKRVSKTWRSLIDDPYFIDLHTNRLSSSKQYDSASADSTAEVLEFVWKLACQKELQFGDYDDEQLIFSPIRTTEFYPHWWDWSVIGSCNGLICLSTPLSPHADDVYLCNPFTREYLNLPRDNSSSDDDQNQPYVTIGFGHDPFANEYKVVRLYKPTPEYPRWQIKVYILGKSDGRWRKGKNGNESEIILPFPWLMTVISKPGMFANGALYWGFLDQNIISFDLADEEFKIIPLPIPWSSEMTDGFGVLGGCLFVYERIKSRRCTNVWVLDKGTYSWIKKFIMPWEDPMNFTYIPLALLSNGKILFRGIRYYKILLRNTCSSSVLSYDPKTRRYDLVKRRIELIWKPAMAYMKSIVSLKKLGEKNAIYATGDGSMCYCRCATTHPFYRRFFSTE